MHESLLEWFNISPLDKSYEGILWIKCTANNMDFSMTNGSTRNVDVDDFCETLLSHIYVWYHMSACHIYPTLKFTEPEICLMRLVV